MKLLLSALLMGACVGCGDGQPTTTVSGKVTFQGKPVTSGLINFRAPGGQPFGGGLQSDGTYEYELPPGDYKVRIDSPAQYTQEVDEQGRLTVPKEVSPRKLPIKYNGFESSGLTATVTADEPTQRIDFKLP